MSASLSTVRFGAIAFPFGGEITLSTAVAAFCGGVFGAAIGGLLSFVIMGFLVAAGVLIAITGGGAGFLSDVAWGSVFGPHIGLLGGAVAAAYAYRRGYYRDGRRIDIALVTLKRWDVLLVGGLTGVCGYLLVTVLDVIPVLGNHLDSIAVTIALILFLARLAFGRTGLSNNRVAKTSNLFYKAQFWLPYQNSWLAVIGQGAIAAGIAAVVTSLLVTLLPQAAEVVHELPFAISSFLLLGLLFGAVIPVTHHITLPAATAAALVMALPRIGAQNRWGLSLFAGIIVGIIGACLGEIFARLWLIDGDTLIDPPALTNAVLLTVMSVAAG